MLSVTELLQNFPQKATEALAREPSNLDEALMRLLVVIGNQWMQSIEPMSSEFDRLLVLWLASLKWEERQLVKIPLHQLKKMREETRNARRAEEERSEGGSGT